MMPPFYARIACWSTRALLCALMLLASGAGCLRGAQVQEKPKIHPNTLQLHQKAEAAERKREHHKARAFYQRAVDTAPDAASAAFATREMASALLFWGEEEGAALLLDKSLQHDPQQVPVWHNLGVVQAKLGKSEEARSALERAIELAPKEPRSRMALAALLVNLSEFRLAKSHYEILLTLKIPEKIERAIHKALEILQVEIERESPPA
jgi:Flp pilus assembly protein TadD